MNVQIRHEPENNRFLVPLEEGDATLAYRQVGDGLYDFRSTLVPAEHRGEGIGEQLVRQSLEHARSQGWSIVPTCPFVQSFLEDHDEYADLVHGEHPVPS